MGREKRKVLAAGGRAGGGKAKKVNRRMKPDKALLKGRSLPVSELRATDSTLTTSKHHTYFEFVENKDKKKKLDLETTHKRTPPPGFEFVPIGNPQLTEACKELSRERDAMVFIVAGNKAADDHDPLHTHMHRHGHHIRQGIVEEVRKTYGDPASFGLSSFTGVPEPLPSDQRLYHEQANAVLRDLFPRIPNTDRHEILRHSFDLSQKDKPKDKDRPVGLSDDIPLLRRVQLAVLAHIRHNHTRYDKLLKETDWPTARKVIEPACLDTLVKWRGDEESGRDQLDEILREVVVISDSEDSDDEGENGDSSFDESDGGVKLVPHPALANPASARLVTERQPSPKGKARAIEQHAEPGNGRGKNQRGFKRYQAFKDRWQDAVERTRGDGFQQQGPRPAAQPPYEMASAPQADYQPRTQPDQPPMDNMQPYRRLGPVEGPAYPAIQRLRTPPSRDLSPQVTERFGNLIFESIEPASPNQAFSPHAPALSPRSPIGGGEGYQPLTGYPRSRPSSHQPPIFPERPPPPQRVHSGQFSREQEFPGGFIEVSHRHVAPRTREVVQPDPNHTGSSSRIRPFEPDETSSERPAKRTYLGEQQPAPQQYIMKDRGGFLEKIPVTWEDTRPLAPVAPDPGFIEIRRGTGHPGEPARVAPYEGHGLRHDPAGLSAPLNQSFPVVPTRHDIPPPHQEVPQYDQYGRPYCVPDPRYAPPGPPPYRTYQETRNPNVRPFSPEYEPRLEPSAFDYQGRPAPRPPPRPTGRYVHNPIVLD